MHTESAVNEMAEHSHKNDTEAAFPPFPFGKGIEKNQVNHVNFWF
jgi:hypothetical protein